MAINTPSDASSKSLSMELTPSPLSGGDSQIMVNAQAIPVDAQHDASASAGAGVGRIVVPMLRTATTLPTSLPDESMVKRAPRGRSGPKSIASPTFRSPRATIEKEKAVEKEEVKELRRKLLLSENQVRHMATVADARQSAASESIEAAKHAENAATHYANEAFSHHLHAQERAEQTSRIGQEAFQRITLSLIHI